MGGLALTDQRLVTFDACRPLGPVVTSNSTAWLAEKWTKTSSPDWRWMNPKPLLALNHFTVPCSFTVIPSFGLSYLVLLDRLQPSNKKGCKCELAAPLNESKGVTRATNATSS